MFWTEVWDESRQRATIAAAAVELVELKERERPPVRSLKAALLSRPRPAVIAEFKRASPSKGLIRPDLQPEEVARAYQVGGAAAISVLTEPRYFHGDLSDLQRIRAVADRPLLRKDFLSDPYQVWEARAAGADAVLLIVAGLGERLDEFLATAAAAGLEALVEVHGPVELDLALRAGAEIIGVNSRDLKSLAVTPATFRQLAPPWPGGALGVAESGLQGPDDIARVAALGYQAVLVGEHLMRSADLVVATAELTGEGPRGDSGHVD